MRRGPEFDFLVDAEHQGFVGGFRLQSPHVVEFLDETLVAAEA